MITQIRRRKKEMKTNRICILFAMFLVANILFGQRKETVSISLDEIKDMPQRIISAYSSI